MNKSIWQRLQPHVIAIAVFLLISIIYCLPAIQGQIVNQSDIIGWKGMAQSSFEYKEKYGHFPLWTNSLFSGMPAFQVAMESKYNVTVAWLHYIFTGFLPIPAGLFFLNCIGFYILGVVMRLRPWVAVFGAIGYAFATYNPIIAEVGHSTKFAAMGYMPMIVAGFLLILQRKYILGFAATMLFTTLQLYQNHVQITYYTILILVLIGIAYAIKAIREKDFKHLFISAALALVAGGIGGASYSVVLMPLNEYAKETMRGGKSELTSENAENKTSGGLDKEYAFRWSYGIDESLTFALPYARGGSSNPNELGENSNTLEAMQDLRLPDQAIQYFSQFTSPYWGDQPNTSGPVYFGAVVLLLAIAGLFIVRGWHLGWIIAVSLLGIMMGWGRNFSGFNYFLFDNLPFYNKFRAPSMGLVLPQLSLALLAAMALQEILFGNYDAAQLWKKLKPATIAAGALAAILIIGFFMADFKGTKDKDIRQGLSQMLANGYAQGQQPSAEITQKANLDAGSIMTGLSKDRKELYSKDLLRSLLFLILAAVLVYLAIRKKMQAQYVLFALIILSFIDLMGVAVRYLNSKNYITEDELLGNAFTPSEADLQIKKDTGYYRVFDQTEDFTNSSRSAYFHNSIGGYHPAKLGLYQDLIERQIAKQNMQVFNMLNTKYFIVADQQTNKPMALPNPAALGPVWLVKSVQFVDNADQEMKALDSLQVAEAAVANKKEQSKITLPIQFDSTATIKFIQNRNDYILYESKAAGNQLAVFSEIYYPYGWKAFIDGKEAPIAKVNYALRAVSIPAGNHRIEMKFEPASVTNGDRLGLIIGIISWLILAACIFWLWKNRNKEETSAVS